MAAVPPALRHRYQVNASARPEGEVELMTEGRPRPLRSLPPPEFGGPGDRWSPETLLVAALADSFVFTFRAAARAANLSWESLECDADGTLERIGHAAQFTGFEIRAYLRLPRGTSKEEARQVLTRARDNCLVGQSLKAPCRLVAHIDLTESTEAA